MDQHGGQGKGKSYLYRYKLTQMILGVGIYLQDICRELPDNKFDLHEPTRRLSELTPYEHLHRIAAVCTVHFNRNIDEALGLAWEVKILMKSLSCVNHPDWDGTIRAIENKGGKKGRG